MPLSRELIDASDPKVAQIGHPAPPWLINYADLMTELCCFFIILFSMSSLVAQKQLSMTQEQIEKALKQELEKSGAGEQIKMKITEQGLVLSVPEAVGEKMFFDSGKAELKPYAREILNKIHRVIVAIPNNVVIEGHTDNVPIATREFPSNWELSTARSTNVLRYLVEDLKFPSNRISASGYGEFRPVAPNDTDENKAKNRRVEIIILRTQPLAKASGTTAPAGEDLSK